MLDFSLNEEQKALVETARRFARERIAPIAAECDRDARFPKEVFVAAHELGLVNATVLPEYGGSGLHELDNALVAEELSWGCTGIQTSLLANTLALTPIVLAGNEEKKKSTWACSRPSRLLPATARPSRAAAATWPASDAVSRSRQRLLLNGEKSWITNASLASFYGSSPPAPAEAHKGIAAFIVDRDTPGSARQARRQDGPTR